MDTLPENIITKEKANVEVPLSENDSCPAYLSSENDSSEYGVVCIQEWWGMNKSICITADNIAKQGLRVIVPDIYRGKVADSREEAGHLMGGLNWAGAINDIAVLVEYLRNLGCTKVAVIGFCMGGALVISSLCNGVKADGGVQFYGIPDLTTNDINNITCPVLGIFGEKDDHFGFSDVDSAKKLESTMKDAGKNYSLSIYEGAQHAFMNQDSPRHDPESYKLALAQTVEFIKSL